MKNIYLKYDSVVSTFVCSKFYEGVVSEKIKGDTLSMTKFENVTGKRREWLITLSAVNFSDITSVPLQFLKNFFCSNNCYLSYDSGAYIEVVINEVGTMPIEYINDIRQLKNITLTLQEKFVYSGAF